MCNRGIRIIFYILAYKSCELTKPGNMRIPKYFREYTGILDSFREYAYSLKISGNTHIPWLQKFTVTYIRFSTYILIFTSGLLHMVLTTGISIFVSHNLAGYTFLASVAADYSITNPASINRLSLMVSVFYLQSLSLTFYLSSK